MKYGAERRRSGWRKAGSDQSVVLYGAEAGELLKGTVEPLQGFRQAAVR